ncbi:MAG: hypothetical protein AABY04_02735 [Candidatus Micrarchaeota archaeon]
MTEYKMFNSVLSWIIVIFIVERGFLTWKLFSIGNPLAAFFSLLVAVLFIIAYFGISTKTSWAKNYAAKLSLILLLLTIFYGMSTYNTFAKPLIGTNFESLNQEDLIKTSAGLGAVAFDVSGSSFYAIFYLLCFVLAINLDIEPKKSLQNLKK